MTFVVEREPTAAEVQALLLRLPQWLGHGWGSNYELAPRGLDDEPLAIHFSSTPVRGVFIAGR